MNWHKLSIEETLKELITKQEGLTVKDADERLLKTGANELEEGKKKSKGSLRRFSCRFFKNLRVLRVLRGE